MEGNEKVSRFKFNDAGEVVSCFCCDCGGWNEPHFQARNKSFEHGFGYYCIRCVRQRTRQRRENWPIEKWAKHNEKVSARRKEQCHLNVMYAVKCGDELKFGTTSNLRERVAKAYNSLGQKLVYVWLADKSEESDFLHRWTAFRRRSKFSTSANGKPTEWHGFEGALKHWVLGKIAERRHRVSVESALRHLAAQSVNVIPFRLKSEVVVRVENDEQETAREKEWRESYEIAQGAYERLVKYVDALAVGRGVRAAANTFYKYCTDNAIDPQPDHLPLEARRV